MRFLRYFFLAFAILLWSSGLFSSVAHWLFGTGFIVDDYRNGDLYRLSALAQFKDPQLNCPTAHLSSAAASTHLYLLGDSFTEPQRIDTSDFRISHLQRAHWNQPSPARFQLDPTKRNILLIESVERHFRQHSDVPITEFIVEKDTMKPLPPVKVPFVKRINDALKGADVEERLETSLFSQDWAFWFKELKAKLNLDWFNRTNVKVSLSGDERYIFTNLDTDTTMHQVSSFTPLSDVEVAALVDTLNAWQVKYKKAGFDEVYLSIIPNKASLLDPNRGTYNHLIERIQQSPRLHMPTIDTYDAFRKMPASAYLKGDTHWNCEGRATWLRLVREKLRI